MLKLSSYNNNKEVVKIRRNKRRGLSLKINQINLDDPLWNRTTCTSCFLNKNLCICLSPRKYLFCDHIRNLLRISENKSIFFTKEGC